MNILKLRSIMCSLFAFVAVVCSYAYGESLPSNLPTPSFHINEKSIVPPMEEDGTTTWSDVSGNNKYLYSINYLPLNLGYNEKGHRYVEINHQTSYVDSRELFHFENPDMFIVVDDAGSNRFCAQVDILAIEKRGADLFVGSTSGITLRNVSLGGEVACVSVRQESIEFSKNGIILGNKPNPNNSDGVLENISISGNAKVYEILIFENLIEEQRVAITDYLMDKYNNPYFDPSIPKEGMTLWLRADTGVTVDSYGDVIRINDQSGKNNNMTGKYGSVRVERAAPNDLLAFAWNDGPSWGNYVSGVFQVPLVSGKSGEFFVVMKNVFQGGHPTRPVLDFNAGQIQTWLEYNFSAQEKIEENFGRPQNNIATMILPNDVYMTNAWRVYNVSFNNVRWDAYMNDMLLHRENYSLQTDVNINSFTLGFPHWSTYRNRGYLAEIIVYNRKLNDSEKESVRKALMEKYSLESFNDNDD